MVLGSTSRNIASCATHCLNALLITHFRHIREHDQLDLFIDSAQTAAINALVDALAARNVGDRKLRATRWLHQD